jgi:hypothetical protein
MKTENVLNLELFSTNEEVKDALLKLCTNNRNLKNFIKKVFRENKHKEICACDEEDSKWDVECYGCDEGSKIAIHSHYFIEQFSKLDDWEIFNVPMVFGNYFHNFNWDDIKLDNGKFLLLTDEHDYLSFHVVDNETMEDGKVDLHGITW